MSKLFTKDEAGISHYHPLFHHGPVDRCVKVALRYRPSGPCWFWFNGTFAPMHAGDTADMLCRRWNAYRSDYQRDPESLLGALEQMSERR